MKQLALHPGDVVVAMQLAIAPEPVLAALAAGAGRSIGECHNALRRLRASGLVASERRTVEREPFLRFVDAGLRVAFPPTIGGETVGIATAFIPGPAPGWAPADPPLGLSTAEFVWPASGGATRGQALAPLHSRVISLTASNHELCNLLALLDLIRVGGAREHRDALEFLRAELGRDRRSSG
jgi:hypothetical protein